MSLLKQLLSEASNPMFKILKLDGQYGGTSEDSLSMDDKNESNDIKPQQLDDLTTNCESEPQDFDALTLSTVSNEANALLKAFAKWLVNNGGLSNVSTEIYNSDARPATPLILQDEESTKLLQSPDTSIDQPIDTVDSTDQNVLQNSTNDIDQQSIDGNSDDRNEDPNKQGMIRTVPNAHLVYKRKGEDGLYNELWIYNIDRTSIKTINTKKDILAGTDIDPSTTQSTDGTQQYELWTIGNATLVKITGLPN